MNVLVPRLFLSVNDLVGVVTPEAFKEEIPSVQDEGRQEDVRTQEGG